MSQKLLDTDDKFQLTIVVFEVVNYGLKDPSRVAKERFYDLCRMYISEP